MATAGGFVQYLHESVVGSENTVPTLAATITQSFPPVTDWTWHLPPQLEDRTPELRGITDPLFPDIVGFGASEHSCTMDLYPDYIGLFFTNMLGKVAATPGDGVITDPDGATIPVGAYRYVWQSSSIPTLPKTATAYLAYPDNNLAFNFRGLGCDQIKLTVGSGTSFSQSAITHKSMYGRRLTGATTPTDATILGLSTTYDAATIIPFKRGQHTIPTWLASTGTAVDIDYQFDNPLDIEWSMGGSQYPDLLDRLGPGQKLTGTLKLRYATAVDWDAFINSTDFTFKSKWVHSQFITGSYPYKLFIEGRAKYTDGTVDALKRMVRMGQSIPFSAGYSASTGYAYKVTLINGVSAYSSV